MKVKRTAHQIQVESPYNPDLPASARRLGGKWDGTKKIWFFDLRDEARVEELYRSIYGEWPVEGATGPAETVTLKVTIGSRWWEVKHGGIFLCGRQVARATGRDSGATLGGGVVVLSGKGFESGGSVKNWSTCGAPGTVFEIRDIPRILAEEEIAKPHEDGDMVEIVGETVVNREALEAEKEALLKRLAEIDKLLEREE